MAFPQAANRRVAGHGTDVVCPHRDERSRTAHPGCGCGSLDPGVTAADDDDVIALLHVKLLSDAERREYLVKIVLDTHFANHLAQRSRGNGNGVGDDLRRGVCVASKYFRRPPQRVGLTLAATLRKLYPADWQTKRFDTLLLHKATLDGLLAGKTAGELETGWQVELQAYRDRRAKVLLYDE